jgi:hypothetical protein
MQQYSLTLVMGFLEPTNICCTVPFYVQFTGRNQVAALNNAEGKTVRLTVHVPWSHALLQLKRMAKRAVSYKVTLFLWFSHCPRGDSAIGIHLHRRPVGHQSRRGRSGEEISRTRVVFLRSVCRLLVAACVVPSSPILVTLMKEALGSSET